MITSQNIEYMGGKETSALLIFHVLTQPVTLCVTSDLDELVRHGEWKSLASPAQLNPAKSQTATSQQSPPAYTKEKGQGTGG